MISEAESGRVVYRSWAVRFHSAWAILMLGGATWSVPVVLAQGALRIVLAVLGGVGLAAGVWRAQRISFSVSDEGIEARNFWRTRHVAWEEIAEIAPMWMIGGLHVLSVRPRSGPRFPIQGTAGFFRRKAAVIAEVERRAREHGVTFTADDLRDLS